MFRYHFLGHFLAELNEICCGSLLNSILKTYRRKCLKNIHTMTLRERIIDHRIRQIVELDLVVVEKERNTGAVCRHNTGHTGYSDESENTL